LPPALRTKYPDSVRFTKEGFPDFKPYTIKEVRVQGLTGNRRADTILANRAAGLKERPAGYTWHHCEDAETMQLVPSDLHAAVNHTGGAAILKGVEP
jgi:filamentous hemagglutinin